jgi:hypothetical protein
VTDILDLAEELAEIASETTDRKTGTRLMAVIESLLQEAGLPPGGGGGRPPSEWLLSSTVPPEAS